MTQDQPQRQGPTPKMLEFAQRIAQRLNLQIPEDVPADFEACKIFIDQNKDAANAVVVAPTDKQLQFATRIGEKKGVAIPEAALRSSKDLSKWIDANKD